MFKKEMENLLRQKFIDTDYSKGFQERVEELTDLLLRKAKYEIKKSIEEGRVCKKGSSRTTYVVSHCFEEWLKVEKNLYDYTPIKTGSGDWKWIKVRSKYEKDQFIECLISKFKEEGIKCYLERIKSSDLTWAIHYEFIWCQ